MNTQLRRLLKTLARGLAVALIALAVCLGSVGCAYVKINASDVRIPGLTGGGSGAEEEGPGDESGLETSGDLRCRVGF
jgi:hypothetical protein